MEIKRCYDTIVGASVAENQLIQNGDFSDGETGWSKSNATVTVSSSVYSATLTASGGYACRKTVYMLANHKYLAMISLKGASGVNYAFNSELPVTAGSGSWQNVHGIKAPTTSGNHYFLITTNETENFAEFSVKYVMYIDLTQKFGSTIADYLYNLETATAGAGIAKLREWGFLTDEYIPYNPGSLESVEATAHKMVGFNQWDESIETGLYNLSGKAWGDSYWRCTNPVKVIPNKSYYTQKPSNVTLYLYGYSDANFSNGRSLSATNNIVIIPNDVYYFSFAMQKSQYGTTYNHDICINLSSDRNGEYEPYVSNTYDLGTDTLRGLFKLDSSNNLYADGDTKTSDGVITRKYPEIDLGTLNWRKSSTDSCFYARISPPYLDTVSSTLLTAKYTYDGYGQAGSGYYGDNLTIRKWAYGQNPENAEIYIHDDAHSDVATFKAAMSGVMLVYELATPTTEQSTPFTSPQLVYPDGTEEFVTENDVPVGHETKYQL